MKRLKKLTWRGRGILILLFLFLGYVIWWMRPANFQMDEIDESVFFLSGMQEVADEENLVKTFEDESLNAFLKKFKDWKQAPFIKFPKHSIVIFPMGVKGFSDLFYESLDQQQPAENPERPLAKNLTEIFENIDLQVLEQEIQTYWKLPELLKAIETQKWYVSIGSGYGEGLYAYWNAMNTFPVLEFLSAYAVYQGDQAQALNYLKASYLLAYKLSEKNLEMTLNSSLIYAMRALLIFKYFQNESLLSADVSDFSSFLKAYPIDFAQRYQTAIKMSYWSSKAFLQAVEKAEQEQDFPEKILGYYPFWDNKEAVRILKEWYYNFLINPVKNIWEKDERIQAFDRRCDYDSFDPYFTENRSEHYYIASFHNLFYRILLPFFYRKNAKLMPAVCGVLSIVSGDWSEGKSAYDKLYLEYTSF